MEAPPHREGVGANSSREGCGNRAFGDGTDGSGNDDRDIGRDKKEIERDRKRHGYSIDEYEDRGRFLTYNQFFDWQGDDNYMDYMEKYQSHQNINGVDVVAFGYYGHD